MKNYIQLSLLILFAISISCSSDDDTNGSNNENTATLSFRLNGELRTAIPDNTTSDYTVFEVGGETVSLITITAGGGSTSQNPWAIAFALNIIGEEGIQINVPYTILESDSQTLGAGYTDIELDLTTDGNATNPARIEFSKFDVENGLYSGNFRFTMKDENGNSGTFQITEGEFSNVPDQEN